jgi:hypothetical protein
MSETVDLPNSDEIVDEQAKAMSAAAELMQKAASDRANRPKILKEVEAQLAKLKIADFPDLADSPIVQAFVKSMGVGDLAPGQSRNRGTLAYIQREWTENDLAQFPVKSFFADESLPITWQGIVRYTVAGEENILPEPFYDIWMEHKRAMKQAKIHEDYLLGYSNQPPHPNWNADSTARVRAFSQLGPHPDSRQRGIGPISLDEVAGE